MITGPRYKIARRLGPQVFEKTQTQKFALRTQRKGKAHETKRNPSRTDYGMQMLEKQKARVTYGVSERQFKKYVSEAVAKKGINSAEALYARLEKRLDNVVARIGLADTRRAARQMVSHGHITVNGRKVTVPSFQVSLGDKIGIREGSKNKTLFATLDEKLKGREVPSWIKFDMGLKEAVVQGAPKAAITEIPFDVAAVIEFYSR